GGRVARTESLLPLWRHNMQKLAFVFAILLLAVSGSASTAHSRRAVRHYSPVHPNGHAVAPLPQDPQAYAEWTARQTWGPNRALCDDGGYRNPCDMYPGGRGR